jgi:hypothetical protein
MDLLLLVNFARCTLPRFAVIVPHVPGDAERIVASITTTWSEHAPCAAASSDAVLPSLILYAAHATFDDAALQSIASLPHVARCFGAVEMLVHPLEPWQDVYLHAPPLMWLNLVLGDGICDGAPHGGTRDRFDYFVLMEPDVLPVRALWLDEVARNVNANEVERPGARWWSFGGVGVHTLGDDAGGADGRSPRVRLHLNGNGVYRLHDAGFEAYVKDVVAAYSLGVPGQRICCYDAALFEHALADFERAHLVLHRFRWSEMILNNQAEWVREEARVRAFAEWRFPAHVFFVHRGTVKGVEEGAVAFSDEAVARIKPLARDALEVPQQPRKARRRGDRITSEAVALAVRRALADASSRCRSGSRIATPRLLRFIPKVSFIRWCSEGLAVNEFSGLRFSCDGVRGPCAETGEQALERVSMRSTVRKANMAQGSIIAGCYAGTYHALRRNRPRFLSIVSPKAVPIAKVVVPTGAGYSGRS